MPNPIFDSIVESLTDAVLGGSQSDYVYPDRFNKALEERGYIELVYGKDAGFLTGNSFNPFSSLFEGVKVPTISTLRNRRIPFFEDPIIKEMGTANYAENRVLLRNEPVRQYVDTKAIQYHVELLYTVPHIHHFMSRMKFDEQTTVEIAHFKDKIINILEEDFNRDNFELNTSITDKNGFPIGQVIKSDITEGPRMAVNADVNLGDSVVENYFYKLARDPQEFKQSELYSYVHYLMNLIRTSIRSSVGIGAKYGPPIAILKFGGVYDRIPCIVKHYKIDFRPDFGNDNASLYPRVIRARFELEEFRQANGVLHTDVNEYPYGWDDIIREGGIPRSKL